MMEFSSSQSYTACDHSCSPPALRLPCASFLACFCLRILGGRLSFRGSAFRTHLGFCLYGAPRGRGRYFIFIVASRFESCHQHHPYVSSTQMFLFSSSSTSSRPAEAEADIVLLWFHQGRWIDELRPAISGSLLMKVLSSASQFLMRFHGRPF